MISVTNLIILDPRESKFLKRWVTISLVLHLIAAVFSVGPYHPDEHFQVLEFANAFMGGTSFKALAWEYEHQMRSWVQPLFYSGLIRMLQAIGIQKSVDHALVFRLVSSFIGWGASSLLMVLSFMWVSESRVRSTVKALALFWVIPYIHARTSGENLGGSLFWIGFSLFFLIQSKGRTYFWNLFGIGCLFGLSFWFRFQMGVIVFSFSLFLLLNKQVNCRHILGLALGILATSFMCIIFDRIGYGVWTFSPWNYFRINLIDGKSELFGVWPWWQYIYWSAVFIPPLSGAIFLAALIACFAKLRHPLVLAITPYFFILCLIKNKDMRYLFVILPALPLLIGMGFPEIKFKLKRILFLFQIQNALFLALVLFKPADKMVLFYSYLKSNFPNDVELISTDFDPFFIGGIQNTFYRPKNYHFLHYSSLKKIEEELDRPFLLYSEKFEIPNEAKKLREFCQVVYQVYPNWIKYFNINDWLSRTRQFSLYRCNFPKKSD